MRRGRKAPSSPEQTPDFLSWIVWRDETLVAVNKPAGVLSQGGAAGANLVDLARTAFRRSSIGVLHRLDRNVSGLVMLALDSRAARGFSESMGAGRVRRDYVAVVRGRPSSDQLVVESRLYKDPRTNVVCVAPDHPDSKPARTEIEVERRFAAPLGNCAVLSARPITGRSHQIRVHLASVGLPIIGDPKYGVGARALLRPLLHARRIGFDHPLEGSPIDIECAPPWRPEELTLLRRRESR